MYGLWSRSGLLWGTLSHGTVASAEYFISHASRHCYLNVEERIGLVTPKQRDLLMTQVRNKVWGFVLVHVYVQRQKSFPLWLLDRAICSWYMTNGFFYFLSHKLCLHDTIVVLHHMFLAPQICQQQPINHLVGSHDIKTTTAQSLYM